MKVINDILNAKKDRRFGNHYVKIDGCIRTCIYHSTIICMINDNTKEYYLNNEIESIGAINTRNKYIDYLINNNYTESGNYCKSY